MWKKTAPKKRPDSTTNVESPPAKTTNISGQVEDTVPEIHANDSADIGQKSTVEESPLTSGNVRIELNSIIEHRGKYYRGVLEVDELLAKELLALDKQAVKIKE